jgi:hypothetical protein
VGVITEGGGLGLPSGPAVLMRRGGEGVGAVFVFVVTGCGRAAGMLRRRLARLLCAALARLPIVGLGLLLLKLPIGLAKPLPPKDGEEFGRRDVGDTTVIWSDWCDSSSGVIPARIAAAESRTEGTECSSCSVVFERGIR